MCNCKLNGRRKLWYPICIQNPYGTNEIQTFEFSNCPGFFSHYPDFGGQCTVYPSVRNTNTNPAIICQSFSNVHNPTKDSPLEMAFSFLSTTISRRRFDYIQANALLRQSLLMFSSSTDTKTELLVIFQKDCFAFQCSTLCVLHGLLNVFFPNFIQ